MSTVVTADNGQQLDLDNLPLTITWAGGFVATIFTVLNGVTYTQTFTNNGTNITNISGWIAS
jgi:hypothetical protein